MSGAPRSWRSGGALADARRSFDDIGSCFDMACGHGRVLRLLAQEISRQRITACDINRHAIRFCATGGRRNAAAVDAGSRPRAARQPRPDLVRIAHNASRLAPRRIAAAQLLRRAGARRRGDRCPRAVEPSVRAAVRRDQPCPAGTRRVSHPPTWARCLTTVTPSTRRSTSAPAFAAASAGRRAARQPPAARLGDHQDVLAFERDA